MSDQRLGFFNKDLYNKVRGYEDSLINTSLPLARRFATACYGSQIKKGSGGELQHKERGDQTVVIAFRTNDIKSIPIMEKTKTKQVKVQLNEPIRAVYAG